jgi:hypothetical protein
METLCGRPYEHDWQHTYTNAAGDGFDFCDGAFVS